MNKPFLIKGGKYGDHRGTLSFVNDFRFENVKRFYTISQSPENGPRAWQGHKTESKYFYCLSGSFKIHLAKIDDWENPDPELMSETFTIDQEESNILKVPGGYVNAILALKEDAHLLVFSEKTVEEAKGDEVKFAKEKWINWKEISK